MGSFRNLNLNNGIGLTLGFVTKFTGLSGWSPIETQRPTGFNLNKYKKTVQDLYNSDVPSAVSKLNSGNYQSITEAMTDLGTVEDALLNHVYWLIGDLYSGGWFMWSASGSGSCQIVAFFGLYRVPAVPRDYYTFRSSSANFEFRVHTHSGEGAPIVDNTIYFLNRNDTPTDGETNHVFESEKILAYVDGTTLGVWSGSDIQTSSLPERWEQSQDFMQVNTYYEWEAFYLKGYTDDPLISSDPHPWERWFQVRVNAQKSFIVGLDESAGTLVGGYIPIEQNSAVQYPDDSDDSGGPPGGDGDKDGLSDDVDPGDVPSSNFLTTGIARIYIPTQSQMTSFNQFLFSDISQSTVDKLKKMWSNPLDYIENVGVCRLHGIPSAGTQHITFGGVDSGIASDYTSNAFLQFDYTASLNEFWGNALDYSSYTKLKIFVPYCGLYDLNVDEFMVSKDYGGCSITLRYRVDLMSGMCVAMICPTRAQYGRDFGNLNSYLYQYNGNIYLPLSLTATDWRNTYQSVLGIAGGMIAPSPSTISGMANNIMSQKVNVQHSGSIGTNFGYMGIQDPFLLIERPAISEPNYDNDWNYGTEFGYPSNNLLPLINANNGFVKVRKNTMWCNNLHATDAERKEIQDLFENEGVWLNYVKE